MDTQCPRPHDLWYRRRNSLWCTVEPGGTRGPGSLYLLRTWCSVLTLSHQRLQLEQPRPYSLFSCIRSPTNLALVAERLGPSFSSISVVRQIYWESGWRGFFRGFGTALIANAPQSAIWWPAYECSKLVLTPWMLPTTGDPAVRIHALHTLAGFAAGAVTVVVLRSYLSQPMYSFLTKS